MRSLTVQIPQPCPERWGDMQPAAGGRFCGSCQKTVIDYTALSDQELVRLLRKASEGSCGRFRDEQLNRPLTPPKPDVAPVWYRWVGVLSMSLFGWQTAQAQQKQVASVSVQEPLERVRFEVDAIPVQAGSDSRCIISGRVMVIDSGRGVIPVLNATVFVKGLYNQNTGENYRTQTDSTGYFKVSIPAQIQKTQLTVQALMPDYFPEKVTVDIGPSSTSIIVSNITFSRSFDSVKRVSITGGGICLVKSPTLWQKVKRKLFR